MARRRHWTPAEDAVMRRMRAEGATFADVSAALDRSPGSCQKRSLLLGLGVTVPRRMAPSRSLTPGSVPATRSRDWQPERAEPVTRDEWRARLVAGARRREELRA